MKTRKRRGGQPDGINAIDEIPVKFRPLLRPMSGVISMNLVQSSTRNILLIGENHSSNECREKGLVPMHEIIIPYLKETPHVDFMFEMDYEEIPFYRKADLLDELSLDEKLAITVAKYIPIKRREAGANDLQSRIHWLDTLYPKSTTNNVDKEAQSFFFNLGSIVDDINRTEDAVQNAQRKLFRILISKSNAETIEAVENVRDTPEGDKYILRLGKDLDIFLKLCISIILQSYRYIKCSAINVNIYLGAFKAAYLPTRTFTSNISLFYDLHRLALDIYACCRLAKNDHQWYKHIVIRVGDAHAVSLQYIFAATGYSLRKMDIPLNPDCE